MEFIKPGINIDFISRRKVGYCLSGVLILISLLSLIVHGGPRYGIDFSGGLLIQVKMPGSSTPGQIKEKLQPIDLHNSSVQQFGELSDNEYLIRGDVSPEDLEGFSEKIETLLTIDPEKKAEVRRVEMVGPQVGKDLREKALFAIFYALLFITIYISGRFEFKWLLSGVMAAALIAVVYFFSLIHMSIPMLIALALVAAIILFLYLNLRYAMGAIVALIHDVFITIGIFSIFDKEFTLPIIAALLTIIGYSLNDTIIVFDRIRENLRRFHRKPFDQVINQSINETLSRTILTSLTTLMVVISLFVLGGGIIHDFAFAMLIGIIIGTYSSIFVASPVLLIWSDIKEVTNSGIKKRK